MMTRKLESSSGRATPGDLWATIKFMNRPAPSLGRSTPMELAEESEEGLAAVLNLIGAIEAGVYV